MAFNLSFLLLLSTLAPTFTHSSFVQDPDLIAQEVQEYVPPKLYMPINFSTHFAFSSYSRLKYMHIAKDFFFYCVPRM